MTCCNPYRDFSKSKDYPIPKGLIDKVLLFLNVLCFFVLLYQILMFNSAFSKYQENCVVGWFGINYTWRQELTLELKENEFSCLRICHLKDSNLSSAELVYTDPFINLSYT